MYNQPPHGYSSNYAYGPSEEQQQQQQWMSQYPADANMYPSQGSAQGSLAPPGPPDWYTQSGPSSYNIPSSYANGNYAPPSHPGYRHSYTPPTNPSTATPDIGDLSYASSVVPKTEEKAVKEKGTKRKRKKGEEATSPTDAEKEKRTKTGRACDACRSKKIRCDILTTEAENGEKKQLCAHCKQYDLECTFFLPITETRFKKKKQATEESGDGLTSLNNALMTEGTTSPYDEKRPREVPVRMEVGPTSLSFLLQTSLPAGTSDAYDIREHNKWEVREDGTGMISVSAPPSSSVFTEAGADDPTRGNRMNKPVLSAQIMSALVNAYFDHIAPLFPVISKADFSSKSTVSPLLLYAICGVGATRRQFPREVFAGVRGVINGLLRSNDILSDARFENVQALLLLAQVGDLHAQPTAATASASLIRMATAIRMAQDLGLHRESTIRAQTAEDLAFVELRRRVWATCVIMDRWYGAALGIPLLVDLLDCDVLLPAPYDIQPDSEPSSWPVEPSYLALAEHLKLSILMGRVLKTIYSPTGLKHATDEQLFSLLADMTAWKEGLPEELHFKGPTSSHASGLLHLGHAALQFLFWRVFMRIQYTCPPHLSFRLHMNNWNTMLDWSTESIEWLAANDEALDTLFIYPYAGTSCALIQYHTWARRRTPEALRMLELVKETATRWERAVQPDQMSIRRKTCETMTLLYEAALKTNPDVEEPKDRPAAINPTAGVSPRPAVGRAIWIKDESRKGGGIWVTRTDQERQDAGVPQDCCLLESELEPGSHLATQWAIAQGTGSAEPEQSVPVGNDLAQGQSQPQSSVPRSTQAGEVSQILGPMQGQLAPPIALSVLGTGMPQNAATDIQAQEALSDMQSGTNVNPSMNFGQVFGDTTVVGPGSEIISNSYPQADGSTLDMSLLDGLPVSGFDFPSWEQYFQSINGTADPFSGM